MPEREKHVDLLTESLKKSGIELVLFDIDDTLLDTQALFLDRIHAFLAFITLRHPNLDYDKVFKDFKNIHNELYKTMAVQR